MDSLDDDDYVIVSLLGGATSSKSDGTIRQQQERRQEQQQQQQQLPKPFTREYIKLLHNLHDNHSPQNALRLPTNNNSRLGPSSALKPHLSTISTYIDTTLSPLLWPINLAIHSHPELNYHEHFAHDTLTDFLSSSSTSIPGQPKWTVTRHAYGLPTAWSAVYDTNRPGPTVSFNAEMDALVGIGHSCGHNLIATSSVAAALATAHVLSSSSALGGKVILLGTPAEEGGGGKIRLLQANAYKTIDISLLAHPGIVPDAALVRTSAYTRFRIEFFGREAHAAANPWLGINALDALIVSYNAISVLRQQTLPTDIIQGHITDGGAAPNIIHAYAAGVFVVRASTRKRLAELRGKVNACFEAGAKATGATMKMTEVQAYADHVPNRILGRRYASYWNELLPSSDDDDPEFDDTEPPTTRIPTDQDKDLAQGATSASTDQGDVSYALPSLHPGFSIFPGKGGQGPHNPEFAAAAGTRDAFERCLRAAKALAGTAVDVLTTQGLVDEVKASWREDMKTYGGKD